MASGGRIVKNGDLWATDVIFSDNSRRPITVQRGENGYRVDWESWVLCIRLSDTPTLPDDIGMV